MKKRMMIFFVLWLSAITAFGQSTKVTGQVLSGPNNEPVIGASVLVKGTTQGTVTDLDGKYSLTVSSKDAILVFSYLSYKTVEQSISGRSVIDVTLEEDLVNLDEVVVIGYGSQRKESVTGSVASMKGDMVRDVPGANISRALQGRIAGVEMSQTSSKPGSSMQIRIRGTRSLNASNDPLVVLNGIPFAGSIGDIDPNDIKSIDILKDASATAIYGSRGANGVLLVTTNKGAKGQKAKISYNGYYGVKKAIKYPMMSGPEFVALRKAAGGQYKNTLDESDDVNTDWQDLLYKTGIVSNNDLGISGGTEKGNYNFGVGVYQDQGVIPMQNYSRYSMRAALDQEVGKYIKLGFSSSTNYSTNNGDNLGTGLGASPIANPYNADGTWKTIISQSTSGNQWVYTKNSLENLGDKYVNTTKALSSYNSMYGEVKIPGVEGLKYRTNLGLDYRQANHGDYTGVGVFSGNVNNNSSANVSYSNKIHWAIENMLTYDHTFAEKHKVNAVAMFSAEQTRDVYSSIGATDIPADAFQFYNLGQAPSDKITIDPRYQTYKQFGLLSKMGRVMYSYDDRYMISATMRSDASSVLAPGHQWNTYPAVSAGWNIKNESFMKDFAMLDALKLRVGYGETSNQGIDPYKTLGVLRTRPYNFGDTYSTGLYVTELPNNKLGWEFSNTWNYGIDFAFFKNRLSGTLEYYVQNTSNVLLGVNLPKTSGVDSYMANIGSTENKGIEFSLNGVILDNLNGFTWEAGFNIYANHNKLVSLSSDPTKRKDEGNLWFVGHPIQVIYDYKKIGLWQKDDLYKSILEPGASSNDGMIKVEYTGEYNTDGTPKRAIGPEDRQVIDMEPNFAGGFNSRVEYKGFELSIVGSFQNGGILNSTLYGSNSYLNNLNTRSGNNVKVDYWSETNTGAKYPKPNGIGGDNPKYSSTLGYFDASYLKVRTITLGYNFSQKWMKNTGIDKMRFYCTVENPFVMFSPYHDESGMDPEPNSLGDQNVAVPGNNKMLIVGTNTPTTRNYLIGLNLNF